MLFPPHLIAIAALTLTISIHSSVTLSAEAPNAQAPEPVRRSSRSSHTARERRTTTDAVGFLAGLNISMPLVATVVQEIVSMYALWARYREDGVPDGSGASLSAASTSHTLLSATPTAAAPSPAGSSRSLFGTPLATPTKRTGRAASGSTQAETPSAASVGEPEPVLVTPAALMHTLVRMRESRALDLAAQTQPRTPTVPQGAPFGAYAVGHGRRAGQVVNKRLERAQAAG